MEHKIQTREEELANAITHGLGILFALVAIPFLIYWSAQNDSAQGIWASSIFSIATLMVYFSSTIYHAINNSSIKNTMRVWDHISIFIMIGGSYTPFIYRYTDTATSKMFLVVMWSIITLGCLKKIFFTGKFELLSVALYLVLGWMIVFVGQPMLNNLPPSVFWLILWGGIAYTTGVIFYMWKGLKYQHAVWHCFVLTGTVIHYFAVYKSISFPVKI